jgi:hypothetical protein
MVQTRRQGRQRRQSRQGRRTRKQFGGFGGIKFFGKKAPKKQFNKEEFLAELKRIKNKKEKSSMVASRRGVRGNPQNFTNPQKTPNNFSNNIDPELAKYL